MKETRKTQTWFVDRVALKLHLQSLKEWSFICRADLESWACCTNTIPAGTSSPVYDDMIYDYVTNCIALAKRRKWIRSRSGHPRRWQVMPIA